MAEDAKTTVVAKLLDSFPTLIALAGIALLVLGLAGGITYNVWLPIPDPTARLAAGILGFFIATADVLLHISSMSKKPARIDPARYGIKITRPGKGEEIDVIDVEGEIQHALPDGYSLRVFRVFPGSERMGPMGRATITLATKKWVADNCSAGGRSGEKRSIAAFIVGPSGASLIDYHIDAARIHRKTMDQLRQATGDEGEYLPAIRTDAPDMFESDRVAIKIK